MKLKPFFFKYNPFSSCKGTLESDLTDHVIYVSVLDDSSYVARISNMLCYMAISKDVLNRSVSYFNFL